MIDLADSAEGDVAGVPLSGIFSVLREGSSITFPGAEDSVSWGSWDGDASHVRDRWNRRADSGAE